MTQKELKQLYYLNKEIEMWRKALNNLENMSYIQVQQITGVPSAHNNGDRTGNIAVKKTDEEREIEAKIAELKEKACKEAAKIINYIESVDDTLVRQVMYHRHVLCFKWGQVAKAIGGGNTGDGLRMMYKRYIEEHDL